MTPSQAEILNGRILIVDDQPANIMLLTRLLSDAGYTDITATLNPLDVEPLHRDGTFDIILLDLQMPEMDGFEVIERLKPIYEGTYLPVIVLTAQPNHKLRALESGAKDFISKPFDLTEVKTRIRNMLEVRLLYKHLAHHNEMLEQTVRERTAELAISEERFRRLTELASDWYWEQDENGNLTTVSGPATEILGEHVMPTDTDGWNEAERETLRGLIDARQPFIDYVFTREVDGACRQYRISGEPIFNAASRFRGYRGIGVEFNFRRSAPDKDSC